jgi:O-acetylserine/cysteine efflux transporter
MSRAHRALAVVVAVVWGVNFVVIDAGLADVPPLLLVAVRFTLVALPLVAVVPRPDVPWRTVLAVGGTMSLGQFTLLYLGMHLGMPPGLASLVLQAQVIGTIVLARLVLRERASRRQVVGALVGTVGLAVVATARGLSAPALPLLVTLAAALSWAIGNVISRRARVRSGFALVVWSALVVPVPSLALSLAVDGPDVVGRVLAHPPLSAVLATAYTVYGASLLGYGVWNGLLARYPAGAVVPYVLLVPPVGIAAAWLLQGERPGVAELAGGAVMLLGVAAATTRPRRRPAGVDAPGAGRAGVGRSGVPADGGVDPGTDERRTLRAP